MWLGCSVENSQRINKNNTLGKKEYTDHSMKLEQKTSPNLENEVDIQKEEIFRTLHRYHQKKNLCKTHNQDVKNTN